MIQTGLERGVDRKELVQRHQAQPKEYEYNTIMVTVSSDTILFWGGGGGERERTEFSESQTHIYVHNHRQHVTTWYALVKLYTISVHK